MTLGTNRQQWIENVNQSTNAQLVETARQTYTWAIPALAVGAAKLLFSVFNGTGTGKVIRVVGLYAIPALDVAAVTTLSVKLGVYRTSAAGIGGTAYNYQSATLDVAGGSVCPADTSNSNISTALTDLDMMQEPTSGATIAEWLRTYHVSSEEIAISAGYNGQTANIANLGEHCQDIVLREDEGMLVKQGAVASAGTVGFLVTITVSDI